MKVRFRSPQPNIISQDEISYVSPGQLFLSLGREYTVYAVSVYDRVAFVQIVDDKDTPVFLPRVLFEVTDSRIPMDWICNLFSDGPVQLVMGPSYVARDLASYEAMVDQRSWQVEQLWQRIESEREESSESGIS